MSNATGQVPNPEQVADRLAIAEVLAMHSRGLDRLDADTLGSCYWPEADVDYGSYKGNAHVFADLVVGALAQGYELTRHGLGNVLFQFDGNTARTETCVSAGHLLLGGAQEMHFFGRYLDTLEKRDNCWKLLHRQVVMDWSKRIEVADERCSEAFVDLSKGGHLDDDPLYPFLQSA